MKNNCLIFFIFITNLLAAQAYESIHQLQSKYYSSISSPPVDKVHIKTGIDILLDKKQNLIADKRIALVTNQTGVDQYGVANYKRLMDLENTKDLEQLSMMLLEKRLIKLQNF